MMTGHAVFTVNSEEIDAPAGTIVFVRDPALLRAARATADDTTILMVGGPVGLPYTVSRWEASSRSRATPDFSRATRNAALPAQHPAHRPPFRASGSAAEVSLHASSYPAGAHVARARARALAMNFCSISPRASATMCPVRSTRKLSGSWSVP